MSTFTIFIALIIVVCFLLVLVVMVQNPKGGGLSSSFGGGGSQQVGGVQKTSDFLDRSTWILASLLLILILMSNVSLSSGTGVSDSKLLQDNPIQQSIPEALPESTEKAYEEIPEIPEIPANN
ncbi:MAG: preprotein translocase subunit SecG [Flavobacteriaceae bacterium]|jgi:preprotein translocase subunit SecG|nr:preprotein translocase subunit SecG [Flavobacteriaceae bacterium]